MTDEEATNGEEGMDPQQRKTILIVAAVIVVLLLCCCLFFAAAWFFGDSVMEQFGMTVNSLSLVL